MTNPTEESNPKKKSDSEHLQKKQPAQQFSKPTQSSPAQNPPQKKNVLLFMAKLDMGGIETLYLNVIPRLQDRYNFMVVYYGEGENELGREFEQLGVKIVKVGPSRYRHPRIFINNVRKIIRDNKIDIFHSNVGYSTFFGLIAAREEQVPVRIAHSHNGEFGVHGNPLNALFRFLCKMSCRRDATCRVNIGGVSAKALFFKGDDSVFIPNGIDLSSFAYRSEVRAKTRKELNLSERDTVFLHVGRFARQKNHEFLIRIFAQYHAKHPDSRLILAGDGELMPAVKKQAAQLGLFGSGSHESVVFLGLYSRVKDLYSAADAFLFPSLYEGLPISLVEAQAAGLPCFASDTIDREAILTPGTFYLSLETGKQAWADAIEKYFEQQGEKRHGEKRHGEKQQGENGGNNDSAGKHSRVDISGCEKLKRYDLNSTVKLFDAVYRGNYEAAAAGV
ncbi:MAG: glycosyltransferase [Bifidobacteriaceae bacterium]|nr:glycosyltransferase [Bifidobacteriaceae bacterium]